MRKKKKDNKVEVIQGNLFAQISFDLTFSENDKICKWIGINYGIAHMYLYVSIRFKNHFHSFLSLHTKQLL